MNAWVVLPTYNEAETVGRMIDDLVGLGIGLSVLVIDDDSPDGTGAIADECAAWHSSVHVVHRRGERGLGTAYMAGFREALGRGAEAVLTMDCDYSHDPRQAPAMLAALEQAPIVVGSRYVTGGLIAGWSWHRRVLSWSANLFVHTLFHIPASDCTSGFRAYRREVLARIPWALVRSTGYSFLVESLLWASRQEGSHVTEIPICFRDRHEGKSKLGWREAVHGTINLIGVWRRDAGKARGRRDG